MRARERERERESGHQHYIIWLRSKNACRPTTTPTIMEYIINVRPASLIIWCKPSMAIIKIKECILYRYATIIYWYKMNRYIFNNGIDADRIGHIFRKKNIVLILLFATIVYSNVFISNNNFTSQQNHKYTDKCYSKT